MIVFPMAPAAAVHRLGHVALRVQDMARAKRFYETLGLRLTWEADDWCYLQWPQTGEGIALLSPAYTAAGPHFAFHFQHRAEVDGVREQLVREGHTCGPVHDHRAEILVGIAASGGRRLQGGRKWVSYGMKRDGRTGPGPQHAGASPTWFRIRREATKKPR